GPEGQSWCGWGASASGPASTPERRSREMTATTSATTGTTMPARRRHTLRDLYHERTNFQFIERSWRWAILSGTAILISAIAFAVSGLNLGIDFEGGTQWQFTVDRKSVV